MIVAAYHYDAFGLRTQTPGALSQTYGFTGREVDWESGLYHYRRWPITRSSVAFFKPIRWALAAGMRTSMPIRGTNRRTVPIRVAPLRNEDTGVWRI